MNKRGQVGWGLALIFTIVFFLIGMPVVSILKPEVSNARTGLDCVNTSISDGTKATCLAVDLVIPYFILLVISGAGGIIASRFII